MTDGDKGSASGDAGADTTTGSSATTDLRQVIDGLNKRIDEMAVLADKRFEGIATKVREIGSSKKDPAPDTTPVTHADLSAAYDLGIVTAVLPDAAREHIAQMSGTMAERLAAAKLIQQFAVPANGTGTQPARAIPPGNAATAAPRTAPPVPTTQAEWIALSATAKKDAGARARWKQLIDDDAFDPDRLPVK